ncbi:PEP-CTERM sorting domain-containing protein [Polymorphobacter sp. PAMC 29334]|uniref:PEP-CTERM sorting domain-containing protein n=1 Tax=Polymorphobacter sp. PAMC 29334 TaxID=2862331 RepID=UPI001C76C836|nr:PEP-CTERM sorting domain-containing protein [Polymorphobacter sp. PAMC 29334]QYE34569.1 PEP-CTERM sorting domain-containing protein [Polymorphobacter sp. PAMC 29334]
MPSLLRRCVSRIASMLLLCMMISGSPAPGRTILFVGNSFTFGANSPVMRYHPERVADLNREGIGGVPALFKTFVDEAGLDWTVSLETSPGKDLAWHLVSKRGLIDRPWDVVILQGYSTLDAERPGDPTRHIAAALTLAALFHARNPQVQVDLMATWSRADQTYLPDGHWYHQLIAQMADDLLAVSRQALTTGSGLHAVVPVGTAWNRAMRDGLADPDPYDGLAFGQVSLWTWDQYHASAEGYYLDALVVFGTVTGLDPRNLPEKERAADDLGLNPKVAAQLRSVAAAELAAQRNAT